MGPTELSFEKGTNFIFGLFDKVATGFKTFYDSKTAYKQSLAEIENAKRQAHASYQLDELETGSPASDWSNPADPYNYNPINLQNPQSLLVLAALGLVIFAVAKG